MLARKLPELLGQERVYRQIRRDAHFWKKVILYSREDESARENADNSMCRVCGCSSDDRCGQVLAVDCLVREL